MKDRTFKRKNWNQCGAIYSKSGNFVLGSVYIPPNYSKSMKVLMKVIDRLRLESLPIIIVGDFNAHHPYWFDKGSG